MSNLSAETKTCSAVHSPYGRCVLPRGHSAAHVWERAPAPLASNHVTPPQWISVEDRYPEVDQDVVYFFDVCGTYIGKYLGEHCFGGEAGFLTDDVTHWMPYKKPKRPLLTTSPVETNGDREARLVAALAMMYDKYEDGTACYEDPDECAGYLGNAIKLTDAEDIEVLSLIPQHRSPEKTNEQSTESHT